MMVALAVITGIIVLLLLLLVIPIRLEFSYQDQPSVVLKYSFLKFILFPSQRKRKEETHKKKRKNQNKEEKKSNLSFSSLKKEYGFFGAIRYLTELLKPLIEKMVSLCRRITITDLTVDITVSNPDAAQAAIEYGAVASVLYPFLGWTGTLLRFEKPSINLGIDYQKEKSCVSVCGCATILPLHIVTTAISVFVTYITLGVVMPQFSVKKAK